MPSIKSARPKLRHKDVAAPLREVAESDEERLLYFQVVPLSRHAIVLMLVEDVDVAEDRDEDRDADEVVDTEGADDES